MNFKLSFRRFKKSKLLLIDDFERNLFNNKKVEVFSLRKIYVFYLFKVSLKNLRLINSVKELYIANILDEIQPRIVIADNHSIFLGKLKNFMPNIITIFYQNNIIYKYDWKRYKKLYQNIKVDFFIAYNKWYAQQFKQIINSNFNLYGNVKNNFYLCNNIKKNKTINFISEFRGIKDNNYFYYLQQEAITVINEFCTINNYNLLISLNSYRKDKNISLSEELRFYDDLKIKYKYTLNKSSYQNSLDSTLTIVLSSNIGIELVSRKIPIFLWNIYFNHNKKYRYPHFNNKKTMYYSGLNKKTLFRKMSKLMAIKKITYNNIRKKDNILYDKNNILLFEKLYNLKETPSN